MAAKMKTKSMTLFVFITSFFFLFFMIIFCRASSETHPDDIDWWCTTTPHPETCRYYMSPHFDFRTIQRSEFREMAIQVAMERALHAQRFAMQFGENCENHRQRAAWNDCFKLYDDIIIQLNRTLQGLTQNNQTSCTNFDAQTWLSTALTNIATCSSGAADLNVSDFIEPITANNVSELISNTLAINGALLHESATVEESRAFPSWVSKGGRKLLQSGGIKADVVVARDGSGDFRTVQAAIDEAGRRSGNGRFVIYVKTGVYRENIEVGNNNNYVMLVGDGMKFTIITGSRSVGSGFTTYNSATAGVDGLGFIAKGITFVNTAGPQMGQAVALRSASDLSVFYRCAFKGYQDTLMVLSQRQFYKECYVYGTIDFIFGNAAVVFQNCMIYLRKPLVGQVNVITAQGRNDPYQNTGITIHHCQVRGDPDLRPVMGSFQTYLGRPWMQYSRTVVIRSYLDRPISPVGWLAWEGSNFAQNTVYYGEFRNFGPRASTRYRVRWPGFHLITSPAVAARFTVGGLLAGQSWIPATGVPFNTGV